MSNFSFVNVNPRGNIEEDCVTRAISLGLGIKYTAVKRLLYATAELYGCDTLCMCCYRHLLEDLFDLTPCRADDGETVEDIATAHSGQRVIIRCDGHLTCSMLGTVCDIWDCRQEPADCYWVS